MRQKITEGSILEINVKDKFYTYAQILKNCSYAFFNYKTIEKIESIEILKSKEVIFIITFHDQIITKGHFLKIGKLEIRDELKVLPLQFIQDTLNKEEFRIYDPNTGEMRNAQKNECIGLECAAVWSLEHVIDRLYDFFNDVPNFWVEQLKIK
jgi:hypothetical protein